MFRLTPLQIYTPRVVKLTNGSSQLTIFWHDTNWLFIQKATVISVCAINNNKNNSNHSSSSHQQGGSSEKKTTFGPRLTYYTRGAKSTVSQEFHPAHTQHLALAGPERKKYVVGLSKQLGALCNNSILTYPPHWVKMIPPTDRPADLVAVGCIISDLALS